MAIKHSFKKYLQKLGLNTNNSVVIGSGILQVLKIRKSRDIDLVVTPEAFALLKKTGKFSISHKHGRELLSDNLFEIARNWRVLGKKYTFKAILNDSVVVNGVRYISLDFLYKVKKDWILQKIARTKDIKDVKLIEKYRSQ